MKNPAVAAPCVVISRKIANSSYVGCYYNKKVILKIFVQKKNTNFVEYSASRNLHFNKLILA